MINNSSPFLIVVQTKLRSLRRKLLQTSTALSQTYCSGQLLTCDKWSWYWMLTVAGELGEPMEWNEYHDGARDEEEPGGADEADIVREQCTEEV